MAINDTLLSMLNQSDVAVHRSIRAIETDNSIHSANLFAPDYVVGMCLVFVMNEIVGMALTLNLSIHFNLRFSLLYVTRCGAAYQMEIEIHWAVRMRWTTLKMNRYGICIRNRRRKPTSTTN